MLNEELMISICQEIDEKLNHLNKFTDRYADYSKFQYDYKEIHGKIKSYIAADASQKLGVATGDVGNFYDNPSFNVQLNATNYENNSIAGCFFVAPVESIISIMNANYDLLKLNEEEREKAQKCALQTIIKTTRVKMFDKTYSVTEQILNLPAPLIKQATNEYLATNSAESLKNKSIDKLTSEERRVLSEKIKAYIWEKYKEIIYSGAYNNTLLNNWSDYKRFFKETYGVDFKEKDENRLSLWQNQRFTAFDNRKIDDDGKTVSLEEQYKLSLKR